MRSSIRSTRAMADDAPPFTPLIPFAQLIKSSTCISVDADQQNVTNRMIVAILPPTIVLLRLRLR